MMTTVEFALFDTPVGRCGIAWGRAGVVGVQLPEARDAATRARMSRRFPGAREGLPPARVRRAIDGMTALLRGEARAAGLAAVTLDMDGVAPFHRRVYETARAIPPGTTLSYGEIAKRMGAPGSARAVGQALGRNPFAIIVPCHRVLAAGGKTGGFSANGGVTTKLKLLALEGAPLATAAPRNRGKRPAAQRELFDGAFGFDARAAVAHLGAVEPALGRLIDKVGPFQMELKQTATVFGALAEAIVYQQLTGKAAATIFGRVCALFPRAQAGPTPEHIVHASDESLRGAGLSRPKILALRDLAARTQAGEVPALGEMRRLDDNVIVERLTAVRGIGRWTAEMLLIFRLGRPDVLPVDDYGIRKGFALAFKKRELPTPKDLAKRGVRWKPYRTVASWYLWRALELAKT